MNLYRYDEVETSSGVSVEITVCPIIKHTPCGAWISLWGMEKFVNFNWKKAPAYTTKERALESFIYRKKLHLSYLEHKIKRTEAAIKIASSGDLNKIIDVTNPLPLIKVN